MTLEDYALIQRELGFIEGITYEIDKSGGNRQQHLQNQRALQKGCNL